MPKDFDPYHRWLGIRPEEQPANYYRLLGLSPFEDDLEVIRDAVERQSGHVRSYALGTHSEISQEILNELGQAKGCLLDEKRKAAYDRELREDLDAEPAVSAIPLPAVPPPFPAAPPLPEQEDSSDQHRESIWSIPIFLAGAVLGFLFLAVVLWIASASLQNGDRGGAGDEEKGTAGSQGRAAENSPSSTARPAAASDKKAKATKKSPAKHGSPRKGSARVTFRITPRKRTVKPAGSGAAGDRPGPKAKTTTAPPSGKIGADVGEGRAAKPVIEEISVSPKTLHNGGAFTLTITARSDSPVNFLSRSFDGPTGSIYGGGGTARFKKVSPGVWQYNWTHTISKWSPSGRYSFRHVSVRNEARLTSEVWKGDLSLAVVNDLARTKPVITDVALSPTTLEGGGNLTLTLTVKSDAPVNFLNCSFRGPQGNIHGGGGTARFKEVSPGVWRFSQNESISKWAVAGQYFFERISVRNEAGLTSDTWRGDVAASVSSDSP